MAVPHVAHTWASGDTITAALLNALELDLAAAGVSSVVANGLTAGASPTASISNGVLTLGIPAGATGNGGAAAQLTIGTVTTLAAGASATATITGTSPNYTLSLGIPQGAAGSGSGSTGAAVLQWQPSTAYSAGQIIVNPSGQVVQSITGFTSGASYSATNWTVLSVALTTTNTLTATGTMIAGRQNLLDATAGALTATLPSPAYVGQEITFERVDTTSNLITIGGTIRGVASQVTMLGQGIAGEAMRLVAESTTSWRITGSHKPNAYLTTLFQPRFQPNTAYTAGAVVVNPSGVLVSANTSFTSGATYSASDWTATTSSGGSSTVTGKGARFFRNASSSVAATTVTAIMLNATGFNDDATYYNLNTGNGQISLYKAGLYLIDFYGSLTFSAAGGYSLFVRQNSTTVQEAGGYAPASTPVRVAASTVIRAAANDILLLLAYLPGSGTADGTANAKDVGISLAYLGA